MRNVIGTSGVRADPRAQSALAAVRTPSSRSAPPLEVPVPAGPPTGLLTALASRWRPPWALAEGPAEGAERSRYICQLCAQLLGVNGAGISMVTATGNRGVVCATDEVSARIEDLQFTLGEGVCVEAVTSGAPVMVADLHGSGAAAAERWPAFMEGVAAAGVRAIFALPLRVGVVSVGALDLYRDVPGALTTGQLSAALTAADAAAVALLQLDTGSASSFADSTAGRAAYQLQVHQASGMVMVQAGVTVEEAFLLLRAHAFAVARPVADVARDVVERRLRFPVEDP